jgi:hypothetical protein
MMRSQEERNELSEDCAQWDADLLATLVAGVKKHAKANYNDDGWDMVVECMEDSEIADEVVGCETVEQAIAKVGEIASLYDERRKDVQAEAW